MEKERVIIGIIGLGLIGGSTALRLKAEFQHCTILGADASKEDEAKAMELSITDELCSVDQMSQKSDIIIVAIPVDASKKIILHLLDNCKKGQVIIDFGSTKSAIAKTVVTHKNRPQYVACHPIAGTENNGPTAAFDTLFNNKVNIVCDRNLSSDEGLKVTLEVIDKLGMRVKFMSSTEHDRHIAFVSHMSHISSFTLGQTVLEVEENEENIFDMAGSGFASTVRLAKSSPEMWAPIFVENADNILEVLTAYIKNLEKYKQMIEVGDGSALTKIMQKTNKIRTVLEAKNKESQTVYNQLEKTALNN